MRVYLRNQTVSFFSYFFLNLQDPEQWLTDTQQMQNEFDFAHVQKIRLANNKYKSSSGWLNTEKEYDWVKRKKKKGPPCLQSILH